MSIPTPFNPLGTLGKEVLPPGFRALDYVKATKIGPSAGSEPWPGLKYAAFNQETDTLTIDGGYEGSEQYPAIFRYCNNDSRFIGAAALPQDKIVRASNGTIAAVAFTAPLEQGRLYHFVIAPDRLSIDDKVKIKNFDTQTPAHRELWSTGALLARVEHVGADGVSVETIVAAERIADGALGLVSLTTGVFLEV